MSQRRVGLLGGTFDPIHCGHVDLGRAAESALGLTEVVVITANIPPHRPQPHASSYHRFAMVCLAIAGLDGWRASDFELGTAATSFTSRTLHDFHARGYMPAELFFIAGADAFAEIETWKDYPAILDDAHFAVVSRPGFPVTELPARLPALSSRMRAASAAYTMATPSIFLINAPTSDVSATAIRRRSADGESIAELVPPAVRQHIDRHSLYAKSSGGASGLFDIGSDRRSPAGRLHGQD
jgi:nicotinate-nucleotide adenylyltransferase